MARSRTDQKTAVSASPVTCAESWIVPPGATLAAAGVTVTSTRGKFCDVHGFCWFATDAMRVVPADRTTVPMARVEKKVSLNA